MNRIEPATMLSAEHLLSYALDGVFVLDRNREFLLFNDACERITGYKGGELVSRECHCRDTLKCYDEYGRPLSAGLCPVKGLFEGAASSARQRMQVRRRDGSHVWVETTYTAVRNGNGEVPYVLGVLRDISEAKTKEDELLLELSTAREQLRQAQGANRPAVGSTPGGGATTDEQGPVSTAAPSGRPAEHAADGSRSQDAGITSPARGCHTDSGVGSKAGDPSRDGACQQGDSLLLDPLLARVEGEAIRRALRAANGQRNKAAKLMGISRSRLYRRMEALGIDPKDPQ